VKLGTSGFDGKRLRRARKARGKTGIEISQELNIGKQSISNYEAGRTTPSPEIAEKISEILQYPLEFFTKEKSYQNNDLGSRFFRSYSAATKKSREVADAQNETLFEVVNFVECLLEFPLINFLDLNPPSDPIKISDEYIEDAAEKLRSYWGLREGPISNTVWLLENNGAIVVRRDLIAHTLDALSLWANARPYFILNSQKNCAARSRFDIGHELGHIILHKNVPQKLINDKDYIKLIENQAHRFSGAFQFPRNSFYKEVVNYSLDAFRLLKRRWKVSIGMMIHRSEDLELINEKKAEYLWREYSKRGWRLYEPLDDEIEIEQPCLIKEALQICLEEKLIKVEDLLMELRQYPEDIEAACGLPSNTLIQKSQGIYAFDKYRKGNETPKFENVINFPSVNTCLNKF
jgi:Zn-dependent peptidase ImmA (M78 family)/DNA-binding XRE family transcriptional regulator